MLLWLGHGFLLLSAYMRDPSGRELGGFIEVHLAFENSFQKQSTYLFQVNFD